MKFLNEYKKIMRYEKLLSILIEESKCQLEIDKNFIEETVFTMKQITKNHIYTFK